MNIQGIQKLTLLDFPGHVACTVFTGGCNFRCPFCHNGDLVLHPEAQTAYSHDDLLSFLKKRTGILDGICVTGGEPLLQPDLETLLQDIRRLGFQIKLDTNGSFPDRLRHLAEAGLVDYVAMDIKNCQERYRETAGLPDSFDLQPIQDSVAYLMSGAVPCEFRTTVVKEYHRPQDIEALGQWIAGADRYFLQRFEASEHVIKPGLHSCGSQAMRALAGCARPFVPSVQVRGI